MEKTTDMILRIIDRSMDSTPTSSNSGKFDSNLGFGELTEKIVKSAETDAVKSEAKI